MQSGARSVALGGQRNEGEDRERCTTTVGNALEGQQNNKTTTLVDSQGWNKQSRGALSGHGTLNSAQNKGNWINLHTETVSGRYPFGVSNAHRRSLPAQSQDRSARYNIYMRNALAGPFTHQKNFHSFDLRPITLGT